MFPPSIIVGVYLAPAHFWLSQTQSNVLQWLLPLHGNGKLPFLIGNVVGAQPSPCSSFARHLVIRENGHLFSILSFAHH